ncbi:universal stress protein UspA [Arachidicoccus ginsenosidimutans]|uniref:universal stress protein n=1 Tax=Arachidicoccus sp. BS20 TaxID=1850526 RepID=UPI0007F0DE2C|nr:universal stress protein [Arachidicoccus sp. BS20]ANI88955.1 universal stress protein UspA [Arachidicoccus sp. BS20]
MDTIFNKILIAVDDSAFSMKAAHTGFAIVHATKAAVALVYVIDQSKEVVNADLGITPEQSQSALLNEAERTIQQYIQLYDGEDEVLRFTPTGIPEEEIINIANQWEADLIVMGTHGRTAIGRILSGSKAEYVVRHATVPVLLTPPRMQ